MNSNVELARTQSASKVLVNMRRAHWINARIREITSPTDGVIRHDQLLAMGLSDSAIRKRVAAGALIRVHRYVYLLPGAAMTPRARWIAAVAGGGPGALLTGEAGADLWRMLREPSTTTTVLTTGARRRLDGVDVRRTTQRPRRHESMHLGIPVTSPSQTIFEYAELADPYATIGVIYEADFRHRWKRHEVLAIASMLPNRKATKHLRFAVAQYDLGSQGVYSRYERWLLELYERAGLELPIVNVLVDTPRGPYLVDQYWPRHGLVIEADGGPHSRSGSRARDTERTLGIAESGMRLFRIRQRHAEADPKRIVDDVGRLLQLPAIR